jgi:hypothetical protein
MNRVERCRVKFANDITNLKKQIEIRDASRQRPALEARVAELEKALGRSLHLVCVVVRSCCLSASVILGLPPCNFGEWRHRTGIVG